MKHFILFTGHMIDAPGREKPRFPPNKEQDVRKKIYERVLHLKKTVTEPLQGIASGACGGDMLFHEVCQELGIPSEVYLPLLPQEFIKKSVSFAGGDWEQRFYKLVQEKKVYMLPDETKQTTDTNVYELTNEWMLEKALSHGGKNMSLIALWDGGGGDGKGGTEHMVKMAKEQGAELDIIDIKKV